jgi:hypothetical protein
VGNEVDEQESRGKKRKPGELSASIDLDGQHYRHGSWWSREWSGQSRVGYAKFEDLETSFHQCLKA